MQVNEEVAQLEKSTLFNTQDGFDVNIRKYKEVPPRPEAIDVKSCHSSMSRLAAFEEKAAKLIERLLNRRRELYDVMHVPKAWATNEIAYIDEQLKKLSTCQPGVSNTHKVLSTRFSNHTVEIEERKRVSIRKKEQRKKEKKTKQNVGKKQAYKLVVELQDKEFADNLVMAQQSAHKLSTKNLGKMRLLPRFHIAAIEYLLTIDAFDDPKAAEALVDILRARKALRAKTELKQMQESDTDDSTDELVELE